MSRPRFHLAFPVTDLDAAERFYVDTLGCRVGRRSERWVDFDFSGHQITAHLSDGEADGEAADEGVTVPTNPVDGKAVPARHFGLVLDWTGWERLVGALREQGVPFLIEPHLRFEGETGEQATLFIRDPSGNCLEFKAFRNPQAVFAT